MAETPVFSTAAVAAPHPLVAETGQTILAAGGNAVEAAVAMAATAAVVAPRVNGLGGDGFWLVREPKGRVHALDASGAAGTLATLQRYRDEQYDAVPAHGADAALTVAGAVGGWDLALELAAALGGHMPRDLLLGDAIRHARDGYAISGKDGRDLAGAAELFSAPGFAASFLEDGKLPPGGTVRRQSRLADTLERLAHAGFRDFYRGDVGRELAAELERIGAPVLRKDLESYRARVVQPLQLALPQVSAYQCPPPSQGLAALLMLGLYERLNIRRVDTAEHHHSLIEAARRALAICDRVVTDPRELTQDPQVLLAQSVLEREAGLIDARRASAFAPRPDGAEAAWIGCIDRDGLAVSYAQSLFRPFGSGCVLTATGVLWHNPGAAFSLDERSLNPLEAGRKPPQSLHPGLTVFADGRVLVQGAEDPQVSGQVWTRYTGGMSPADAVEEPRWLLGRGSGGAAMLRVENGFDPGLLRALLALGHPVDEAGASDAFGGAGILVKHPRNGRVEAACDPRGEGAVLGL
jgi:gamma-glutamyltranspeptidase/glutathione hydrolase